MDKFLSKSEAGQFQSSCCCIISGAPILLDFLFSHTESPYIFTCVSSLSPPTEVIWEVDGERIYFNDSYSDYDFTQTLVNCTTSTYYNTLSINGTIDDVIGEYSCTVVNSLGSSNTLTKTIKGVENFVYEANFYYSTLPTNITCYIISFSYSFSFRSKWS